MTGADGVVEFYLSNWDGSASAVVTMEKKGYDR